MITLVIDKQTDYFWDLVKQNNLGKYFFNSYDLNKVEIVIIKTPTTVDQTFLNRYPKLKMIIRAGSGYDNIDLKITSATGIIVCNTPEANAISAFEHTLSLILALIKHHQIAKSSLLNNSWKEYHPLNCEINELQVLVVGVGRIGTRVAQTLKQFGAEVWGHDPYLAANEWEKKGIDPISYYHGLNQANMITYHCPLNSETRDYFSVKTLELLPKPIWLINTARGGIVNEQAINQGLLNGKILGVGLDVFESEPEPNLPFIDSDNIFLTPHTGAYTVAAKKRLANEVISNWLSFVVDGIIKNKL